MKLLAIIPLFNKEETIKRAIESVRMQTTTIDLLIVNDGSTDGSAAVVDTLKNDNTTVISQTNAGVSVARNVGIHYAIENDYTHIAFLDGDDHWKKDHIKHIVELINAFPEASVYGTGYEIKQFTIHTKKALFSNLPHLKPQVLHHFFEHNFLNSILTSSSSCFKSAVFKEVGLFNPAYSHGEDTDLFIRAGIYCKIAFYPDSSVVIDRSVAHRSAARPVSKRRLLDLDIYDKHTPAIHGLKKYLDLNRFSLSLAYRLENDFKKASFYKQKIDTVNLTPKQNKLLELGTLQLKALKQVQKFMGKLGWYLRTGT